VQVTTLASNQVDVLDDQHRRLQEPREAEVLADDGGALNLKLLGGSAMEVSAAANQ
jgi:hypothetical protein